MSEHKNENTDVGGDYSSKSDFSKAQQVDIAVKDVREKRSKEMKPGYTNQDRLGNITYVPDSRKEFISSVRALKYLLDAEISKDEEYQKQEKRILAQINEGVEKFGIYPWEPIGAKVIFYTNQPKYIPALDQEFPIIRPGSKIGTVNTTWVPGYFNHLYHQYWTYLVEVYEKLYGELNKLIDRLGYFDEGTNY